jgi:hydrogenase-4 component B
VLKPTKQTGIEYRDEDIRYFPKTRTVELGVQDVYKKYFYQPLLALTTMVATRVRNIQSGSVNMYILYIFLILIAMLYISSM